jgi:stearoyl-CoA desaturase (delta-9 desaturase)
MGIVWEIRPVPSKVKNSNKLKDIAAGNGAPTAKIPLEELN